MFGGPYSNLQATKALFEEATKRGFTPDRMICTGDVIAYGADASETLDFIRASGCHVIMGNCEESLAFSHDDCGCGFAPGTSCDRLAASWFAHAEKSIDENARAWMATLPRRLNLHIGTKRLAVLHGGVQQINRYIFASSPSEIKRDEIAASGCDGIIAGHCGLPFTQIIDGLLWHNAGAIGLPANDGTANVWFSTLTPEPDGLRIAHHALSYDFASAARNMRVAELPDEYARAMNDGLWPSCDILPFREIRERGVALREGGGLWPNTLPAPLKRRASHAISFEQIWPDTNRDSLPKIKPEKFRDPYMTAKGETRAHVALGDLKTLWFNTGTLCNITCRNCYIESSPKNDRLVYLRADEVSAYLDEIQSGGFRTDEIGFTGGEPFMNPDIFTMLDDCLMRGYRVLMLTNAMKPMQRFKSRLLELSEKAGARLTMRISLDHFTPLRHEDERGPGTFQPTLEGLIWLARNGFHLSVAGRTMWGDDLDSERAGYAALFAAHDIPVDAYDPAALVLFPEMDPKVDVPEITNDCWGILHTSPHDQMCASSRMVVKRKGAAHASVVACTLLPYDPQFELGATLQEARTSVQLNHPHCARFCVLGGASCSAG